MPEQPEQLLLPQRPLILGIGGCSGSGKTTLARELTTQLSATLLPLDFYYVCLGHLPPDERALQNFDHPDSLEHSLLALHVAELADGRNIERPIYDFTTHTRVPNRTETVAPSSVLIVEGHSRAALFKSALALRLQYLRQRAQQDLPQSTHLSRYARTRPHRRKRPGPVRSDRQANGRPLRHPVGRARIHYCRRH